MISLRKRARKSEDEEENSDTPGPSQPIKPFSLRDTLLQKEVMELTSDILPSTVRIVFPNPNSLNQLLVSVRPTDGYWVGGVFDFQIMVPDGYNMVPPKVRCLTRAWHPNINLQGQVCLSLLRVSAVDGLGWTPTRRLKDVVLGLDALFGDLVNFDDPLNQDAADQHRHSREVFLTKIRDLIRQNPRSRR